MKHNGRLIKWKPPERLTPLRRQQLEGFRFYNTSLDEALEELAYVERELLEAQSALRQLQQAKT